MSTNLSFLDKLMGDLIKPKHNNYSEDCLSFYVSESSFIMEDLNSLINCHQEKIKCTLIKHRLNHKQVHHQSNTNKRCIIYLHGLGSSRLQALSLVQHLPKNYCLAMFDLSGSGKSDGEYITYGLKEHKDIQHVINYLHKKKYIRQFVIWGRSMGAVATLLYAIENCSTKQKTGEIKRKSFKNKNERSNSLKTIVQFVQQPVIKAIVLDSPFHNFRQIARELALKKLNIPAFIIDIALDYLQQSFNRILNFESKYNPFNINFQDKIQLEIPIIFMYSEQDQIIPSRHCERIIKNVLSHFQKLLINQCSHNQSRPQAIVKEVFNKLQKFNRQKGREVKRLTEQSSQEIIKSESLEKKRGIFVFTPSKQLKRTVESDKKDALKFHEMVDIDQIKTQEVYVKSSSRNRISATRKSYISIESSRQLKKKKVGTNINDSNAPHLSTIDIQTNKLIGKKLIQSRQNQITNPFKTLRSKRANPDKKKEIKLTHERYLQ